MGARAGVRGRLNASRPCIWAKAMRTHGARDRAGGKCAPFHAHIPCLLALGRRQSVYKQRSPPTPRACGDAASRGNHVGTLALRDSCGSHDEQSFDTPRLAVSKLWLATPALGTI